MELVNDNDVKKRNKEQENRVCQLCGCIKNVSLMNYLKDKKYFGINDIKKWMEL